ncbi:MAG: flagellin, partial [Pseudomonadota bacterium]
SSTVANLTANSESLSASRSRIMDADFASETANLTRGQILQQAGTAMLAQANQLPNGVLSLLRG